MIDAAKMASHLVSCFQRAPNCRGERTGGRLFRSIDIKPWEVSLVNEPQSWLLRIVIAVSRRERNGK